MSMFIIGGIEKRGYSNLFLISGDFYKFFVSQNFGLYNYKIYFVFVNEVFGGSMVYFGGFEYSSHVITKGGVVF